ncbi:MAG: dihydrodipicolinate synthase family protein [Candidatus Binataceae bacterium]
MNRLDDYVSRPGLSVPIVTVLDRRGEVLEAEQRAVIRYVVQDGAGADIVFAAGTNGEWNRLDNPRRQRVFEIAVEECRRLSADGKPIEAWLGVTGHNKKDTLANLARAIELEADAAVVAPLSIQDVDDVAGFVERDIAAVFERHRRELPVFLYENADIAAPGKPLHLDPREVATMSRLSYVRGIKVTADRDILNRFIDARAAFISAHDFPIYAGNAYLIFDLFAAHSADPPIRGIVCGQGNMTPREWKRAWHVALNGERALIERYRKLLDDYRRACFFNRDGREIEFGIASLKATLAEMGVITSEAVAPGTLTFKHDERREFARRFQELRKIAAETAEPGWLSEWQLNNRMGRAAHHG